MHQRRMPLVLGMQQQQGEEGAADQGDSLTASNALRASSGRAGRQALAIAGSGCEAAAQPAAASGMHLRSAQKRLLAAAAAEAAARTDSGVGSSQQLDRTDSCGGSADVAMAGSGGKRRRQQVHQEQAEQQVETQVQQSQQQAPTVKKRIKTVPGHSTRQPPAAAAAEPSPKRRRVARAGVPIPLPAYELRTFDRASPPFRWVPRRQRGPRRLCARWQDLSWRATQHVRTALPAPLAALRFAAATCALGAAAAG